MPTPRVACLEMTPFPSDIPSSTQSNPLSGRNPRRRCRPQIRAVEPSTLSAAISNHALVEPNQSGDVSGFSFSYFFLGRQGAHCINNLASNFTHFHSNLRRAQPFQLRRQFIFKPRSQDILDVCGEFLEVLIRLRL